MVDPYVHHELLSLHAQIQQLRTRSTIMTHTTHIELPRGEAGFASSRNEGFSLTFENGWTISVQWGPTHYSSTRDLSIPFGDQPDPTDYRRWTARSAEVHIWDHNAPRHSDGWELPDEARPEGWVSTDDVAAMIAETAARPATEGKKS